MKFTDPAFFKSMIKICEGRLEVLAIIAHPLVEDERLLVVSDLAKLRENKIDADCAVRLLGYVDTLVRSPPTDFVGDKTRLKQLSEQLTNVINEH